jgi:hypothetical protein
MGKDGKSGYYRKRTFGNRQAPVVGLPSHVRHDNVDSLTSKNKTIMPKQKGTHRLLGTTGDMTYQKTKDGYSAREKTYISPEKIRTSEAYARTRENMAEFGRAGKASKVLRAAFAKLIKTGADTRMTSRLTTNFLRIVKSDPINDRGQRLVTEGDIMLLEGFDFNIDSLLFSTFTAPYTATIDRATGLCTVTVPPFVLQEAVTPPEGSTHMRLVAAAASLDFENSDFISHQEVSPDLLLSAGTTPAVSLTPQVEANSAFPLFLVLGVQFTQVVNGKPYLLNKGTSNAMCLVKIDPVPTAPEL